MEEVKTMTADWKVLYQRDITSIFPAHMRVQRTVEKERERKTIVKLRQLLRVLNKLSLRVLKSNVLELMVFYHYNYIWGTEIKYIWAIKEKQKVENLCNSCKSKFFM